MASDKFKAAYSVVELYNLIEGELVGVHFYRYVGYGTMNHKRRLPGRSENTKIV